MKTGLIAIFTLISSMIVFGQDAGQTAILEKYLEKAVAEGIIPGGVFQLRIGDKEVFNKTVGYADMAKTKPYKEDDIFRIASMTKAVTVVAVMQLYEQGLIQIDDEVSKYIPAFANTKVFGEFNEADSTYTELDLDRQITIRHLLTHTSGIYYGSFSGGPLRTIAIRKKAMQFGLSHDKLSTKEMVEQIAAMPLAHQPGTRWTYGVNMEVLGHIVELVSGQPLDEYFSQHIFEPLGMNDTYFYIPDDKAARLIPVFVQLETGTFINPDPNMAYPLVGLKTHFAGGGGLSSTAGDYMTFIQALLNGGTNNGVRILGRKTIEYMSAPQTAHLAEPMNEHTRPLGNGFGLGFHVYTEESLGVTPHSPGTYLW